MSYIDLEDEDLMNADENELDVEGENLLVDDGENVGNQNAENAGNDTSPSKDATKVAPKKRIIKNPQPKLNYDRLKGPRGLLILESSFKDIKFKGKGYEKEDLTAVMTRLEQWTHRLFPKFTFDDTLEKLEKLGHKKDVSNFVRRIRLDMIEDNQSFAQNDIIDDKDEPEVDPFDSLTQGNPLGSSTQVNQNTGNQHSTLSHEQRERMIRNRLLAEERRLARMKSKQEELALQQELEMQRQQLIQSDERSQQHLQNSSENCGQPEKCDQQHVQRRQEQPNYWDENEQQNFESMIVDQLQDEKPRSQEQRQSQLEAENL